MSISGSLFAGVSGLRAQSTSMGIISDNIANANTVGYKGSKAQFETLVTAGATRSSYSPGGALPRPGMMVSQQGLLNASTSATDIGINGSGFFAVTNSVNVKSDGSIPGSAERNYTRAGSYTVSKDGYLINSAGYTLLGVPTNTSGTPSVSNPSVLTLQPVGIGTVTGSSSPTTELKIGANLPAVHTAPSKISLAGTVDPVTASGTQIFAQASTTFTLYSSTGKAYALGLELVKTSAATTGAETYQVRATGALDPLTGSPADASAVTSGTVLGTITVSNQNLPTVFTAGTAITLADGSTMVPTFDVSNLKMGSTGGGNEVGKFEVDSQQISSVIYDSLGVAHNLTLEFSRSETNDGATISNSSVSGPRAWAVKIVDMTIAGTGAPSVDFTALGSNFPIYLGGGAPPTEARAGTAVPTTSYVNFNSDGTMSSVAPNLLPSLPLTTGASNFGGSAFTFNLGSPGSASGLTCKSDEFAVSFIKQNGIPYGFRNGVEIDKEGLVRVTFDNGQSLPIFKLPIVTFANPNMLEAKAGNVFSETIDSGSSLPNFAGVGGSGTVSPASLEASTVDIAEEFTNMIVTQRSYSANARTITTSDEMMQEVLNMKR